MIEVVCVCGFFFPFRPLSWLLEIICLNLTRGMITPEMKVCDTFNRIPEPEVLEMSDSFATSPPCVCHRSHSPDHRAAGESSPKASSGGQVLQGIFHQER